MPAGKVEGEMHVGPVKDIATLAPSSGPSVVTPSTTAVAKGGPGGPAGMAAIWAS